MSARIPPLLAPVLDLVRKASGGKIGPEGAKLAVEILETQNELFAKESNLLLALQTANRADSFTDANTARQFASKLVTQFHVDPAQLKIPLEAKAYGPVDQATAEKALQALLVHDPSLKKVVTIKTASQDFGQTRVLTQDGYQFIDTPKGYVLHVPRASKPDLEEKLASVGLAHVALETYQPPAANWYDPVLSPIPEL